MQSGSEKCCVNVAQQKKLITASINIENNKVKKKLTNKFFTICFIRMCNCSMPLCYSQIQYSVAGNITILMLITLGNFNRPTRTNCNFYIQ